MRRARLALLDVLIRGRVATAAIAANNIFVPSKRCHRLTHQGTHIRWCGYATPCLERNSGINETTSCRERSHAGVPHVFCASQRGTGGLEGEGRRRVPHPPDSSA
ncbi:MAG: hypothetical protein WCQ72_03465 [Eubacteriales bacterium]